MAIKEPKNIKELRDDLLNIYGRIENKQIPLNMAKEKANVAGKILGSLKLQMEYNDKRGQKDKEIDFLNS